MRCTRNSCSYESRSWESPLWWDRFSKHHLKVKLKLSASQREPRRLVEELWWMFSSGLICLVNLLNDHGQFERCDLVNTFFLQLITHFVVYPLTRAMSSHNWCCHENGDTLGWHIESLPPCWYKLSLDYSCAVGLNIRPHLEDKTAEACKNEQRGERLARPTPCFLVTIVWAGGAVLWLFIWLFFLSLVSNKRVMS